MNNFSDIMRYEFMIELEQENQKILELCYNSKYSDLLNGEEWCNKSPICENTIVDSIIKFFKYIYEKISDFFKKIVKFLKGNDTPFKPNKKVIIAAEQKIKSISKEEADSFIIKNINFTIKAGDTIAAILQIIQQCGDYMNKIIESLDKLLDRATFSPALDLMSVSISNYDRDLDKKYDLDSIKQVTTTITYNDIPNFLKDYKDSKRAIKLIQDTINATTNTLNKCKSNVEKISKDNTIENKVSDHIDKYKNVTIALTNVLSKAFNAVIKISVAAYQNEEDMLVKFIKWNGDNTSENESAYLGIETESLLCQDDNEEEEE